MQGQLRQKRNRGIGIDDSDDDSDADDNESARRAMKRARKSDRTDIKGLGRYFHLSRGAPLDRSLKYLSRGKCGNSRFRRQL